MSLALLYFSNSACKASKIDTIWYLIDSLESLLKLSVRYLLNSSSLISFTNSFSFNKISTASFITISSSVITCSSFIGASVVCSLDVSFTSCFSVTTSLFGTDLMICSLDNSS